MTLKDWTNQFRLKVDIALFLQIADDHLKRYWVKSLHNLFIHLRNRTLWPNVRFDTLLKGGLRQYFGCQELHWPLWMTSLTKETRARAKVQS